MVVVVVVAVMACHLFFERYCHALVYVHICPTSFSFSPFYKLSHNVYKMVAGDPAALAIIKSETDSTH